jgi:hypothetical protein
MTTDGDIRDQLPEPQRAQPRCFQCQRPYTPKPDADGCTRFCSDRCRCDFDAGLSPGSEGLDCQEAAATDGTPEPADPTSRATAPDGAVDPEPEPAKRRPRARPAQNTYTGHLARHAAEAWAKPALVEELQRDQRQFDPFSITKWKVAAGGDPGYLPKTQMRMGTTGFWITCARCSAEFESKGLKHCEKCRTMPAGKQAGALGAQISARSRCRRCRVALPNPVESQWSAFCSRDCYTRFYRCHCLVCQEETEARSPKAGKDLNLCGRKCRTAYEGNRAKYQFLGGQTGGQTGGRHRDSQIPADSESYAHSTRTFSGVQSAGPVNLVGRRNPWDGKLDPDLAAAILETEVGRQGRGAVMADIVPDGKWPGMRRVVLPDGSLSDMLNPVRAQDLALAVVDEIPVREAVREGVQEGRGHPDSQNRPEGESYAHSIRVHPGVQSTTPTDIPAGPIGWPGIGSPPAGPVGVTGTM